MKYYKKITDLVGNMEVNYSIDMLEYEVRIKPFVTPDNFYNIIDTYILLHDDIIEKRYDSFKFFTYRDNISFYSDNEKKEKFYLGLGFNTNGKLSDRLCKIRFNPNKTCYGSILCDIMNKVNRYCDIELKKIDIAVDFPVDRKLVRLRKDNRKYRVFDYGGGEYTEYLGSRSSSNSVKLYNKTNEDSLSYDCTRFELTYNIGDKFNIPDIMFINSQIPLIMDNLNDTELFILKTLINEPSRINELGRKYKEKMKKILYSQTEYKINEDYFIKLSKNAQNYYNDILTSNNQWNNLINS